MENKSLWKLVKNLWDNGKSFEDKYKKFYDYYDGKLTKNYFGNEEKTSENIIEEIIETKVNATLDAPFTIQVVPSISPLKDISEVNNHQTIADVLNEEMHHILRCNNFQELKEKVIRYGEIMGFSAIQTLIEEEEGRAEIKLEYISPENIRFDKGAKTTKDWSFVAYKKCVPPQVVKEMYCKNEDGSFDIEKCAMIDKLTSSIAPTSTKESDAIVGVKGEKTSSLVYNNSVGGIQAGKTVELIVMFLVDTSVYAPEKQDNAEIQAIKQESIYKYPNGRLIVFSPKDNVGMILEDKKAPKGFKNLANIDIFNPLTLNNIEGKSEVEDLIPIQNRINGTLSKMAFLISQNINAILVPEGVVEVGDDAFVSQAIIKSGKFQLDGATTPQVLKNEMIIEATKLESMLQRYEKLAYTKAHLNETMINGARQIGTTSGEQVEQLNESPMSSIRLIQKNLKNFIVEIGNKIVSLIQEYYTENRIIEISTGLTVDNIKIKFAEFGTNVNNQQVIKLYTEAQKVAKEIILNPDWKYTIEVVAGTEIPRSRKELAMTMERIFASGILNANQDIDILEQYLKSLDIPNYRAICTLLRGKQEAMAQQQTPIDTQTMLTSPELAKSFGDIIKGLEGFSKAKGQVLAMLGLDASPDTFASAPVQEMTSKSSASDIATILPEKVSNNPVVAIEGQDNAVADKLIEERK